MKRRGCAKAALVGMVGGLVGVTSAAFVTWGVLALSLDGPGRWAGALFALISLPLFIVGWRVSHRRRWIARGALLALWCGVLAWWLSLEARNDRDWLPEVSRLPSARIEGNRLTFSNVRAFEYRSETDFTPSWEERAYDLDRVRGVDLFLSDWGAAGIVHTILSWEFEGGEHLAVSIETRKEQGEGYSALRGFFRQFELYYVFADERDVIGLRARFRGDHRSFPRLAQIFRAFRGPQRL